MSNTKHTPDKWFLAYDPDLNDTSLAGLVTNPKAHALTTERETLGNINHKYVPVELAIQAPELLKERDELKAEIDLLQKANDGLRTNVNLYAYRQNKYPDTEKERTRLAERLNASTKAYAELKALNCELLEASEQLIEAMNQKNVLMQSYSNGTADISQVRKFSAIEQEAHSKLFDVINKAKGTL